jgi:hypothetical protein
MRRLEVRAYYVRSLGVDPGPDMDYRGPRKLTVVKPQPQTEDQRKASEDDPLLWEEFLGRGVR